MRPSTRRTATAAALALPVGLAALAAGSPRAWAGDDLAAGMVTKFGRGLVNASTGWLELPKEWVKQSKVNPAIGWLVGTFSGVGMTIYRAGAGVYDAGFFWLPVPPRFESVIRPNTVFGDAPDLR